MTSPSEHNLPTLGLPPVNSLRRGYPSDIGAHIALSTTRECECRCELWQGPCGGSWRSMAARLSALSSASPSVWTGYDSLCGLIMLTAEDIRCYSKFLPLYFPRSLEEELANIPHIPADIGTAAFA